MVITVAIENITTVNHRRAADAVAALTAVFDSSNYKL
jgi:hypothetical protein